MEFFGMTRTLTIELYLSEAMVTAAKQYAVNIPKIACDAVIDELKKKIEVYSDVAEMSHSEKNRILRGTLQDKNRELLRMQESNAQLLDDLRRLTKRSSGTINADARISVWGLTQGQPTNQYQNKPEQTVIVPKSMRR